MMQDRRSMKIIIIAGSLLFVIIPLLTALIAIASRPIITEEEALSTTVDEKIAAAISEQNNVNLEKTVLHEITRKGDWVAIGAFLIEDNDFNNYATFILHNEEGNYYTKYVGTSYNVGHLTNLGIPIELINEISQTDLIGQYLDVIGDSNINPANRYPIIKQLPFTTDSLKISYLFKEGVKNSEGIDVPIIEITGANAAERSNALYYIRNLGYDIGDYPVIFNNLKNPFPDGGNMPEEYLENSDEIEEIIIDPLDVEGP